MGNEKLRSIKKCEICGKQMRRFKKFKEKLMCAVCYRKRVRIIGSGTTKPYVSLEKALLKIYEVKGYVTKMGKIQAMISTPQILIGHKIKFILIK